MFLGILYSCTNSHHSRWLATAPVCSFTLVSRRAQEVTYCVLFVTHFRPKLTSEQASTKERGTCPITVLGISIHFGLMHQTLELREILHFFKVVRGWMLDNECGIYNESENSFNKRSTAILELRRVTTLSVSILTRVFFYLKKTRPHFTCSLTQARKSGFRA